MRSLFIVLLASLISFNCFAGDSWPAIGKFKLISVQVEDEMADPEDVFGPGDAFQSYFEGDRFLGQVGENKREMTYTYDSQKKELTLFADPEKMTFKVLSVGAEKYSLMVDALQLNYERAQ